MAKLVGEHRTVALGTLVMTTGQFLISFSLNIPYLLIFTSVSSVGGSFLRPTINAILSKETKEGQGTTLGTKPQFILTALILSFGFLLILRSAHLKTKG